MAIEDNTTTRGYPLPHEDNFLQFDVARLRAALEAVDSDVDGLLSDVGDLEASKGEPGGLATLDGSGHVPASQLPSYVDDVLEFANYAALPTPGEAGKIYVLLTPHETPQGVVSQFRWGGSAYVPITSSPGSTDAVPEGSTNLYHTAARVRGAVLTGLSLASNAVISATDTVLSALGKLQKQISEKQDALVSGDNVKTINGESILGSGDLQVAGAGMALPVIDLGDVGVDGSETVDIDLSSGDFFLMSMQSSNTTGTLTLNFTNIPDTTGKRLSWHVRIQRGGRKGALAFTQAVNWSGGVISPLNNASGSWDLIMFYKLGNANIRAMLVDCS